MLPDTAERVASFTWAADNKTILYATEDATTKRSDLVHRHEVGTDAATDPLVFNEKDERFDVSVGRMCDGKYLLLESGSHITSEVKFVSAATPAAPFTVVELRRENVRYSLDEGNGLFYLLVNDTDPANRLVTAPVATPGTAHWTELMPARHDTSINDVDVFKSFYVVMTLVEGLRVLTVTGA